MVAALGNGNDILFVIRPLIAPAGAAVLRGQPDKRAGADVIISYHASKHLKRSALESSLRV
jgi:hypothetical protein